MEVIRFEENVFKSKIDVLLNCTLQEKINWIKTAYGPTHDLTHEEDWDNIELNKENLGQFHCFPAKDKYKHPYARIIWVERFKGDGDLEENLILVHEVEHAVFHTLRQKNLELDTENEEVFCYLTECYLREIFKRNHEKKNNKSPRKNGGDAPRT